MSRLPENNEYQQHQQQKSPQAGEDPAAADGDTVRKSVDAGAAAADSRDFGALYANVSGQPLGDYPADEHRTAAMHLASAVEQMRDKNLSGVVHTIEDEGPPGYEEDSRVEADTAWQDEVAPGNSGLATFSEGHESESDTGSAWINSLSGQGLFSSSKLAFFGLLLGILVILVVIGVLGGGDKDISSPAELNRVPVEETQPVASVRADQAADSRLREIQEMQLQINARLHKLESDIAALAEDNSRQWVANEAVLGAMRGQQHSEQALVASRIDALQKQVATLPVAAALPEVSADSPVVAVTELSAGSSVTSAPKSVMQPGGDGDWTVNLASFSREEQAGKLLATLKRAGIPVEQQTASLNGDTRYRLRVTGFTSRDEAKRYAGKLDKGLGLGEPWVSRR